MNSVAGKRLCLALLIAIATVTLLWWIHNNLQRDQEQNVTGIALLRVTDGVVYRYDEIGDNTLILKSPEVRYYADKRGTCFQRPKLTRKHAATIDTLSAMHAVENQQRTQIHMWGNVLGVHKNLNIPKVHTVLESDTLNYHITKNEAETDDSVVITTTESKTSASGAIWQLNENLFILNKNIRSHYAPDQAP